MKIPAHARTKAVVRVMALPLLGSMNGSSYESNEMTLHRMCHRRSQEASSSKHTFGHAEGEQAKRGSKGQLDSGRKPDATTQ
jgi:hypothetical protein